MTEATATADARQATTAAPATPGDLEALPGVGPALAQRLRRRFGDDTAFFQAAQSLDVGAIAATDGVSERRAVQLIQLVQGHDDGSTFLATDAARRVHDTVLEHLLRHAATARGRNRLRLLRFHDDPESAQTHAEEVLALRERHAGLDPERIHGLLRRIRPLDPPRPKPVAGRLLVAEDDAVRERLHALGLGRHALLGSPRDLQDAGDYDLVVLAYEEGHLDVSGLPNAVEASIGDGVAALCPEAVLERLAHHRDTLEALAALAEARGHDSAAPEALALLPEDRPKAGMGDDDVRRIVQDETDRLEQAVQAATADLSLRGADLVQALSGGPLPVALRDALEAACQDAQARVQEATGLTARLFRAALPVRVDEAALEDALAVRGADDHRSRFLAAQKAAARAEALLPALEQEVEDALEFDARFALAAFADAHGLQPFRFTDRIAFTDSLHLDLAGTDGAQPIAYRVGGDAPVTLLTGANSGGKSTLLEHLGQLVVMARLGLPLPGRDVEVPWLDEVHLVTARRGMDAGAFETFLRSFLPVVQGDAKRLVLVDEVEAITELDAAARILAFTLDRLATTESLGVVVTHLAEQVLQHVDPDRVRVDGIEATGLDDEQRLVVDRTPRMGAFARSTPELIVRRLAATTKGTEQALYQDLLGTFAEQGQR